MTAGGAVCEEIDADSCGDVNVMRGDEYLRW